MKVVVTGSSGFIGNRLTRFLLDKNIEVLGIDPMDSRINDKLYTHHKGFSNSLTSKIIDNFFNSETVLFHIGALKHRSSLNNYNQMINSNVIDFQNLIEIAKAKKIKKILYTSSLYVYGVENESPYSEQKSLTAPSSLYGITKLLGEKLLETFSEETKITSLSLRLFFVYGPNQNTENSNYDSLIHKSIKLLKNDKSPEIYGTGEQTMDFIYVDDLCNYMLKFIHSENVGYSVLNFASGNRISVLDTVKKIINLTNSKNKIVFRDADWTNNLNRYGDNKKLLDSFIPVTFTSFEDGLIKCINSHE